jgi:two-component system phosphate regulon sensor histidine kinase PhoR
VVYPTVTIPPNTERELECALVKAEYDALRNECGAGVFVLDQTARIVHSNATAAQLLGCPSELLTGKTLLEATLSSDLHRMLHAVQSERIMLRREICTSASGGRNLIISIVPVGVDPAPTRYLLLAQDVTELRRLETIRRDFVANVSHELRTPLASIRAMAETLQDGALGDPSVANHFLGTIVNEAQRLTRISEDLLILSRAESQAPEKLPFDLSELVGEVIERFESQAEKASIQMTSDFSPGLEITANRDQIEQVVLNLVDNAIKYTPAGGRVAVTADQMNGTVSVHVTDTGIGIMSKDVPRIFERFYRVDKARSRQSGGTGLGLSIVKHIVESHGGVVTVESEFNRGSTFTFTLPVQHP